MWYLCYSRWYYDADEYTASRRTQPTTVSTLTEIGVLRYLRTENSHVQHGLSRNGIGQHANLSYAMCRRNTCTMSNKQLSKTTFRSVSLVPYLPNHTSWAWNGSPYFPLIKD